MSTIATVIAGAGSGLRDCLPINHAVKQADEILDLIALFALNRVQFATRTLVDGENVGSWISRAISSSIVALSRC